MNQENVGQGAPSNTEIWDSVVRKKKSKSKWIYIILAFVLVVFLAVIFLPRLIPRPDAIGTSGLYTEQEVQAKADEILGLLVNEEYENILSNYSTDDLKAALTASEIQSSKEKMSPDWGAFSAYGEKNEFEVEDKDIVYAVVQAQVIYLNKTVLYTLYFDESMQLAGLYMR